MASFVAIGWLTGLMLLLGTVVQILFITFIISDDSHMKTSVVILAGQCSQD